MKRKLAEDALNGIRDEYILEAAAYKKRRVFPWIGAVAAVLALIIGLQFLQMPLAIKAEAVALAEDPRVTPQPEIDDYQDLEQWRRETDQWVRQRDLRNHTAQEAMEQMESFLAISLREFLGSTQSNTLYSPINAYFGLAMTAELTGGSTRQQLLDVLGTPDLETLRSQASALWENIYENNGKEISTLANSLWLDETLDYNRRPMAALSRHYYASVYQQDLSDPQAVKDIQTWLDQNTGGDSRRDPQILFKESTDGFLQDAIDSIQLPPEAVMVLYSTIYFRSRWEDEFSPRNNTEDIFHGTASDAAATFMNKSRYQTHYYFGEDFGAIALDLKNGSRVWFLLPDEGKTVEDVLDDSQYLQMITSTYSQWTEKKYMLVNLSVPQFDVQTTADLRSGLENMGITDLFDPTSADFSPSIDDAAFIAAVNQSVRVAIDEQGVTAAAYVELPAAGSPMPPDEIIDFILNRPFLFIITSGRIPLFAGVINQL